MNRNKRGPSVSFLAGTSKRPQNASTNLQDIDGHIQELIYPACRELFDGFAVISVSGRRVAGKLPFLDFNFVYHFRCKEEHNRYGVSYKIEGYQDPPFEPFKLSCITLANMLVNTLGFARARADRKLWKFREQLRQYDMSTSNLDPDWLLRVPQPQPRWLISLAHASLIFKYRHLIELQQVWSVEALGKIPVTELSRIVSILPQDIASFCFHWKNDFDLPELTLEQAARCAQKYNRPLTAEMTGAIICYTNFKGWRKKHGQMSMPREAANNWPYQPPFCIKNDIIRPVYVLHKGESIVRLFITADLRLMQECAERINKLFLIPTLAPKKLKNPPSGLSQLNAEQRVAYNAVSTNNFIIVLGDAGTGKTLLGEFIYRTYKAGHVLPVAFFGKVAANLKDKYGRGMTIHKLATEIRHQTKRGLKIVEDTEILIIDEGSTVTLDLLNMALAALPNLKKVIILGDEKQMPPPVWGAIFDALIAHFAGTPSVHRLTEVMRIDDNLAILKSNFDRIIAGNTELDYSTELDSEHPFVVLKRESISREREKSESAESRIARMRRSLRPIFEFYPDAQDYHIVTQKNTVRQDLNHAVFAETRPNNKYTYNVFMVGEKIMFKENDYGTESGQNSMPPHVASSPVMNGEIAKIVRIVDLDPNDAAENALNKAVEVQNTNAPKQVPFWHRVLVLDDERRVNLSHYPIGNIVKGTVSTTASVEGSEYEIIVVYIHDNFSDYLIRKEFYTAITRARRRVIVITDFDPHTPGLPEVTRIVGNNPEPPECVIGYWMNPWTQAPVQGLDEDDESEMEE
jgi:hypothetical protein